jgi:hypothetical protein
MLLVIYERLPDFCFNCKAIGHNIAACKWLHLAENKKQDRGKQLIKETAPRVIKQEYVAKAVARTSKLIDRSVNTSKSVQPLVDSLVCI